MKVSSDDIAHVIELWTGIPASKIKENELSKIAKLDKTIKEKIIGQDEAVDLVCAAIRRSRAQISPRKRPASFIFVGPTGVGKTELVKVLSSELFDSVDPLIRLDMSEFMEKHAVSRIVGSPPGYVGYDEAGQLTEKVRRKPYSVILFDEIEKAHPDVMNILLQILDEGKITDSHGRVVNFENTVVVMTSNAGSTSDSSLGFTKSSEELAKDKAMKGLRAFLRPEFIGRVDEIVPFSPLSDESLKKICKLMLDEFIEPLMQKGVKFSYSNEVLDFIVNKAESKKSGARELRHMIRKHVEDKIAVLVVNSANDLPLEIFIDVKDNEIVLIEK
jgi:ATP-dependent Clp protease ATP-binding subunit ClpA